MNQFSKDIKKIIGAKVTEVRGTCICFDNGVEMTVHPYETYIDTEDHREEEDNNG